MTSPAAQRRFDAIQTLTEGARHVVFGDEAVALTGHQTAVVWDRTHADRAEVAADIRVLAGLGRTERWTLAVEKWAAMVEDSCEDTYKWAFDQFCVWACYAAE